MQPVKSTRTRTNIAPPQRYKDAFTVKEENELQPPTESASAVSPGQAEKKDESEVHLENSAQSVTTAPRHEVGGNEENEKPNESAPTVSPSHEGNKEENKFRRSKRLQTVTTALLDVEGNEEIELPAKRVRDMSPRDDGESIEYKKEDLRWLGYALVRAAIGPTVRFHCIFCKQMEYADKKELVESRIFPTGILCWRCKYANAATRKEIMKSGKERMGIDQEGEQQNAGEEIRSVGHAILRAAEYSNFVRYCCIFCKAGLCWTTDVITESWIFPTGIACFRCMKKESEESREAARKMGEERMGIIHGGPPLVQPFANEPVQQVVPIPQSTVELPGGEAAKQSIAPIHQDTMKKKDWNPISIMEPSSGKEYPKHCSACDSKIHNTSHLAKHLNASKHQKNMEKRA